MDSYQYHSLINLLQFNVKMKMALVENLMFFTTIYPPYEDDEDYCYSATTYDYHQMREEWFAKLDKQIGYCGKCIELFSNRDGLYREINILSRKMNDIYHFNLDQRHQFANEFDKLINDLHEKEMYQFDAETDKVRKTQYVALYEEYGYEPIFDDNKFNDWLSKKELRGD